MGPAVSVSAGALGRGAILALVLAVLAGPILAGMFETARAAFGAIPALGLRAPPGAAWAALLSLPGFWRGVMLSLFTGITAALLSLALALGLAAALHQRLTPRGPGRWLLPWLAVPHAALALGLAFVLAPSGWIARLLAPVAGWDRPPVLATVNDPHGLALILGLVTKEVPFLLLVILAALSQVPARSTLALGRSLGYRPATAWLLLVLPQIWPRIRLPVWAVVAYGVSVVDMALILGPSNPPVLSVLVLRLYADPDLARLLPASAGALTQGGVVVLAIAFVASGERLAARLGRARVRRGSRRGFERAAGLAVIGVGALLALGLLALLSLGVWSLAWRWAWPGVWPDSWSLRLWSTPGRWLSPLLLTLGVALAATALSLALAVAWLQAAGERLRLERRWTEALIWLPLIVPQIGFLYGVNVAFLRAGMSGGLAAVIWGHVLFVFPYVLLVLAGPWRAVDRRLLAQAAALGAGPMRRLFAVRLPVLLRPLCTAVAIGVAVSVAQYLPTLLLGAGRIETLTTEAVTLAAGADRRVAGVMGVLQALVPMAVFALALAVPGVIYRNRRGMEPA